MVFFEILIISSVLVVIAGFFGMAGRTAFALLVSPSFYSLLMTWPYCSTIAASAWGSCPMNVVAAPLLLLIGPLAHDEEPPPNPYPGILLVGLTIVIVWTAIVFVAERHQRRSPKADRLEL